MSMTKQSQANSKTKSSLDLHSGIGISKESIIKKNASFVHGGRKVVQKKNLKIQK